MDLIEESKAALIQLAKLTGEPSNAPDPATILALKGRLIGFLTLLGEEYARKFKGKEAAYIRRKVEQAKQYRKERESGVNVGDSTQNATLAVGEERSRELDAMEEYETLRSYIRSLQSAISHAQQVVSFYRKSDSI